MISRLSDNKSISLETPIGLTRMISCSSLPLFINSMVSNLTVGQRTWKSYSCELIRPCSKHFCVLIMCVTHNYLCSCFNHAPNINSYYRKNIHLQILQYVLNNNHLGIFKSLNYFLCMSLECSRNTRHLRSSNSKVWLPKAWPPDIQTHTHTYGRTDRRQAKCSL